MVVFQYQLLGKPSRRNPEPAVRYWNLDSGASNHISEEISWLKDTRDIPSGQLPDFENALNEKLDFEKMGDVLSKRLRLHDVLFRKSLEKHDLFISVGQLTDAGHDVVIGQNGTFTIHLTANFNHIVGRGSFNTKHSAYIVEFLNDSVTEGGVLEQLDDENLDYPVAMVFSDLRLFFIVVFEKKIPFSSSLSYSLLFELFLPSHSDLIYIFL